MKTLTLIMILCFSANSFAQSFNIERCMAHRMFDRFPPGTMPPTTPVINIHGHEYRLKDACHPILVEMEIDNRLENMPRSYVESRSSIVFPGEFWYSVDKEDFAFVAIDSIYKGKVFFRGLIAQGGYCSYYIDGSCDSEYWKEFGVNMAQPSIERGNYDVSFEYSFPQTEFDGEIFPEHLNIVPPAIDFVGYESVWEPRRTKINNADLISFDFKQLVKAAKKEDVYTTSFKWENNNDLENIPTQDSGMGKIKIHFGPLCPSGLEIKIIDNMDKKFVFDNSTPGKVIIKASVGEVNYLTDEELEQVEWSMPEKNGSSLKMTPADGIGRSVVFEYTGLFVENIDFGETLVTAKYKTQPKCKDLKDEVPVKIFFPRDFFNNPDNSSGPDAIPNWFYYWQQTKAGHGTVMDRDIKYRGLTAKCAGNKWLGYYWMNEKYNKYNQKAMVGEEHVNMCDLHKLDNIYPGHSSDNFLLASQFAFHIDDFKLNTWSGIDTFGQMLLHELTHRKHWREWWNKMGGWPIKGYLDKNRNGVRDAKEWVDEDFDYFPDKYEGKKWPGNGRKYIVVNPDTFHSEWGDPSFSEAHDEHHITYSYAESNWIKGTANKEDWSVPGKQWESTP